MARTSVLAILGALLLAPWAHADQQRDPELEGVIRKAIAEAQCFTDQYDSAVWYTRSRSRGCATW
jgi:hypothetical protein